MSLNPKTYGTGYWSVFSLPILHFGSTLGSHEVRMRMTLLTLVIIIIGIAWRRLGDSWWLLMWHWGCVWGTVTSNGQASINESAYI